MSLPRSRGSIPRLSSYCSTPQHNKHVQKLAIKSFVSYAANADAFVVVAPPVGASRLVLGPFLPLCAYSLSRVSLSPSIFR